MNRPARPAGARGFYTVAGLALLVSLDTSWRFFGERLHITDLTERAVMFVVLEAGLIACGYGMRANVQRDGRPGAPRVMAWALCALSAYMATQLTGLWEGVARVSLGPALGLIMLHLALGIEVRHRGTASTSTAARVARELRERALSRFGLSDDDRDAAGRTRDRAARRVARLALSPHALLRDVRFSRALRTSHVAHDDTARARMLAELAVLRHGRKLADLEQPSPWANTTASEGASLDENRDPDSEETCADGVLDGAVLMAATPPGWEEMTKRAAVARADALLPGRGARMLALALGQVGVDINENAVRSNRSYLSNPAEAEPINGQRP